eukprot:1673860-Rhodomonas_salina.2
MLSQYRTSHSTRVGQQHRTLDQYWTSHSRYYHIRYPSTEHRTAGTWGDSSIRYVNTGLRIADA